MDAASLRDILHYDPETGLFTWSVSRGPVKAGAIAGTPTTDGGLAICINYRVYQANRLAWLYMTGSWPSGVVDHKDGNRANNVWKNLRDATLQQNNWNRKPNSSGLKGVSYVPRRKKWRAQIRVNGKKKEIGVFPTPEAAHAAYVAAAEKLHGEYLRTA